LTGVENARVGAGGAEEEEGDLIMGSAMSVDEDNSDGSSMTEDEEESSEVDDESTQLESDDTSSQESSLEVSEGGSSHQHRLVTLMRNNPAAHGLFFDLEVVGKLPVQVTAFGTGSHITCPHPLRIEISVCRGGGAAWGKSEEADEAAGTAETGGGGVEGWQTVFSDDNSTALPQLWDCAPESPGDYGVLPLSQPLSLAPGERVSICISTWHPHGLILRALQPATKERPETRPGTGKARFSEGDKSDGDSNIALFAGPAIRAPVGMGIEVRSDQEAEDSSDKGTDACGAQHDAYAFVGTVFYSTLRK
jgi:hypothetical protein